MIRLVRLLARLGWPMRLLDPLFGRYNPFHPDFRADPYPRYRRLQQEAPVYHHPIMRAWFLSRYDDVLAVLRDPASSVQRMESHAFRRMFPVGSLPPAFAEWVRCNLLMVDPPEHTRLRGLVGKAFTPRMVERLVPRIGQIADALLDAAEERREIDWVRDVAVPLPVTVIAEMLGVPPADRDRLKRWSDDLAALLDPISAFDRLDATIRSAAEFGAYLADAMAERRVSPRDDLLSALVAVEEEGDRLSAVELSSMVGLLLGAGHETTTNLLGNAVVGLLRHPRERKRLREDPSLLESAVEEFLRFDPPVQMTDRIATRDLEIGGTTIRAGEVTVLLLAAANRDPRRFADPDRLDVGRTDNRHLSFGQGAHFCLGAHLARVEARIALGALLRRFPDFDGEPDPPGWNASITLRGPSALPLRLA